MFLPALIAYTPIIEAQEQNIDWWSMFHHDSAHTGYSTSIGPLTNQTLWKAKIWNFTTNGYVTSSPAVADGIVYFGSNDHNIYALNDETGQKVWSYKTGDAIDSHAAIASNVVYLGSKDDYVYALAAKTGDIIWTYKTGADVESFTSLANGVIYIDSNDYYIYAIGSIAAQQPASPSPIGLLSPTVPEFPTLALLLVIISVQSLVVFKLRKLEINWASYLCPHLF